MSEFLTPEEIEQQKEDLRQHYRDQIDALKDKIKALNGYKGQLETAHTNTNDNVYLPESGYDLSCTSDIAHWAGKLEESGVNHQSDTANGISTFMSGIMTVIGKIDEVIAKIELAIGQLEKDLAAV